MVVGLACVLGDEDKRLARLGDEALRDPDGDGAVADDRHARVGEAHDLLDDRGVVLPGRKLRRRHAHDDEVRVVQVGDGAEAEWGVVQRRLEVAERSGDVASDRAVASGGDLHVAVL